MGHIVADFIDTGILTADIIKTGILESKNGKSWLNMSTGEFNFGDKVKYEDGKFEIIVESSDGGNTSLGNELNNIDNKIDSAKNEAINSANNTLTTTIANYYTKSQTDSKISVAKDEINLGVSNTYETKTNVESKVVSTLNSAKSYSDTKKTEAINAAATDATNKVNSAKTELNTAIGKKANSVDVYTKTEVYTKGQTDSAIKVAKDEINLGVSGTYETKANVESKIQSVTTTIENITVGGRNYLINSDFSKTETKTAEAKNPNLYPASWGSYNSGISNPTTNYHAHIDNDTFGYNVVEFNESDGTRHWKAISQGGQNTRISTSGTFTFSVDMFATESGAKLFGGFYYYAQGGTSPKFHSGQFKIESADIPVNEWGRCSVQCQLGDNVDLSKSVSFYIYGYGFSSNAILYIKKAKLEFGNKPTDWQPEIQDTKADIQDAKNEAINSANNTLTTTIANYYTKEQTNSQINIAKEAINLGVSQTYETKANVSSQVTSTLNSAKSYADTKKTEAINSAATDATSKVNAAKSELNTAIGKKANTVDVYSKAEVYTKGQTDSAIKVAKDEINLGVSNTYETKANVETKVSSTLNSAKSYADTKKTEAINTASTDATNKANQAKTDAINSANNTLTTTIKNYYTKAQTDSQINVAKNAITSSVSSTYATKTDVTSSINGVNSSISNLQNRMNSAEQKITDSAIVSTVTNSSSWQTQTSNLNSALNKLSINEQTKMNGLELLPQGYLTNDSKGYKVDYNVAKWQNNRIEVTGREWISTDFIKFDRSKPLYWYINANCSSNNKFYFGVERFDKNKLTINGETNNAIRYFIAGTNFNGEREGYWQETDTSTAYIRLRILCDWNNTGTATTTIKSIKWKQLGASITDDLTTRMSAAESKITDTAITNVVKQNFYTKSETDGQITSKGYQTSSQVQQTVDALQLKFTQSGGYNLLRNGKASLDTKHWVSNGGGISRTTDVVYGTCFKTSLPGGIKYNGGSSGSSSAIRLKNNTHYVYEATIYSRTALPGTKVSPLHFRCGTSPSTGGIGQCSIVDYRQAVPTVNKWTKCYVHILTASSGEVWFTPFIYTGGSYTGDLWVTEISLSEGAVETPYSPHASEIYDGVTTIDKDGVTVKSSNGAYTNFNSVGMNSFNNSGQQTLGIRNGGITFHPYSSNQLGAYITQSALHGNSAAANGLAISTANNGTYISLGTSSLSDANTTLNMEQALTVSANDNFQPKGINLWKDTHAHGYGIRQLSHLRLAGSGAIQFDYLNTSPSTIYEAVDGGHSLYVMGGYQMHLGCMDGKGVPKGVIWMQNSTNTHSYTHWDFHNYTMYNMKTATSYANTLSRKVNEVYGVNSNVEGIRYLYKNVELVNGKAIRSIPLEYKGCEYDIVSIVCKGRGNAWVETEDENRFEINGECESVNIEIIIYPSEAVMTASTQQLEEAPTLELPKKTEPEEASLITNEAIYVR